MKKLFLFVAVLFFVCESEAQEQGVVINGVTWATCNVGNYGTFVSNVEDYGNYYTWLEARNNACPSGWRLPTYEEIKQLIEADNQWTTINGVGGRKFGSGNNTIFLPAAGSRGGMRVGTNGCYWSSELTGVNNVLAVIISFTNGVAMLNNLRYTDGLLVRCVR